MKRPTSTPSEGEGGSARTSANTARQTPTAAAKKGALNGSGAPTEQRGGRLHETVTACVRQYLAEIDGEPTTDFYQLVLSQVEPPLLREVMAYTRHNQTRAAELLGLNRGTLRKKLRQYDISSDSP